MALEAEQDEVAALLHAHLSLGQPSPLVSVAPAPSNKTLQLHIGGGYQASFIKVSFLFPQESSGVGNRGLNLVAGTLPPFYRS